MEWEAIVNEHANAKKNKKCHTRSKKYLHQLIISCVVGLTFAFTTIFNLVHPVLGSLGVVVSLMIAFYNLGRVKECAK